MKDLLQKPFIRRFTLTFQQWKDDHGSLMAAAVAYYAALSFFPLMLVTIAALGWLMQATDWGKDAEAQVLRLVAEYTSRGVEQNVAEMLQRVQDDAAVGGPIGLLTLLLSAAALFVHFDQAFDRIWKVQSLDSTRGLVGALRAVIVVRFRAFATLLGLAILIVATMVAGVAVTSLQQSSSRYLPESARVWWLVQIAISMLVNTGIFTLVYRYLPKVSVRWRDAAQGGLLAALIWEVGRVVLTSFLVGNKYSAYGIVGSFIAVMVWIYYAASVVFLAAEYVQVICAERDSEGGPPGTGSAADAAIQDRAAQHAGNS